AEARWLAADEPLRAARRRRAEIAPLLDAMGTGPQVDDTLLERSARLHGELSSVEAAAAAPAVEIAGEARLAALRQEIASTGLAGRLGVDSGEIGLLSERLPALDALHAALLREQARSESRRAELDALRATAAALAERCTALAHAARVSAPVSSGTATTQALLERARHALAGIDDAIALHRRRHELQSEDTALSAEEGGMS